MDIQLPEDQGPLRGELADTIKASGLSNTAYARRAQVDQGDVSRFLSGSKSAFTPATWLKLAAAAPESTALRQRFAAHMKAEASAPSAMASAPGEPGELFMASYAELLPSPHNPRKSFNNESIEELAGSIAEKGLLQNLNVCARGDGTFEINGGERRWRAIGLLVERGAWQADEKRIPCRLISFDQKTADLVSIIENLQREDVPRHEQADAIARLRDVHKLTTAEIAKELNVSKRYVEQSLNLVDRLAPEIREELVKGEVTFEQARQLWTLPAKLQLEVRDYAMEAAPRYGGRMDITAASTNVLRRYPKADDALFDPADYSGETLKAADDLYFLDLDLFEKLQAAALDEKRAALSKRWKSVHELGEQYFSHWDYSRSQARAKGEAFIRVMPPDKRAQYGRTYTRVEIYEGYYKPAPTKAAPSNRSAADDGPALPNLSSTQLIMAHGVRSAVLQRAVAAAPLKISLAALCVSLLTGYDCEVRIKRVHGGANELRQDQSPAWRKLLELLKPLADAGVIEDYVNKFEDGEHVADWTLEREKQPEAFRFLLAHDGLEQIVSCLIALACGSWPGFQPSYGDDALITAIAEASAATCEGRFTLTREYLQKCTKPQIAAVARAAIRQGHAANSDMPQKKADAIDWLLEHPDRDESWCAPEYAFASEEENKAAYEAMMKGEA